MSAILDNPVWYALSGPHAMFVQRVGDALRYEPECAPFSAVPDTPGSGDWAALGALVGPGGAAVLFRTPVPVPAVWEVRWGAPCLQMLAPEQFVAVPPVGVEPVRDRAPLESLVRATQPGPWGARTADLGAFVGVYERDDLVAAAGERMRLPGATEISAVCTAEDHRGRGLARAVVSALAAAIRARGEVPFLHVLTDNASAIRSYERLGFTVRRKLEVTLLAAP